jgi:hypothetical protein
MNPPSVTTEAPRSTLRVLTICGCLAAIALSAVLIYGHFKAPAYNAALHQRIGEVMAEQTDKALGHKGRILLITIPTGSEPELGTQLAAFEQKLKRLGNFEIKEHQLDTKGQAKYGVGSGLSGRRLVRAVKNHPADAIVSFVGAPELSDAEIAELKQTPIFIAESRSADHLPKLFEKRLIQVAVVSRFVFPAPGPLQPRTPQEWFDKRYQILTAESANTVPQ